MSKRTEISMHVTTDSRSHKIQRRERIGKNNFDPLHYPCRRKHGVKKPKRKNHRRSA